MCSDAGGREAPASATETDPYVALQTRDCLAARSCLFHHAPTVTMLTDNCSHARAPVQLQSRREGGAAKRKTCAATRRAPARPRRDRCPGAGRSAPRPGRARVAGHRAALPLAPAGAGCRAPAARPRTAHGTRSATRVADRLWTGWTHPAVSLKSDVTGTGHGCHGDGLKCCRATGVSHN